MTYKNQPWVKDRKINSEVKELELHLLAAKNLILMQERLSMHQDLFRFLILWNAALTVAVTWMVIK